MWKKKKNNTKMAFNTETVMMAAKAPLNTVLTYFQTTSLGLTDEEVEKRLSLYGKNEIVHEQKKKPLVMLAKAFINPFVGVLTALVAISFVMDVWMAWQALRAASFSARVQSRSCHRVTVSSLLLHR
jgi:Mg2+-importing ATPase